jgi:hypothetical protein
MEAGLPLQRRYDQKWLLNGDGMGQNTEVVMSITSQVFVYAWCKKFEQKWCIFKDRSAKLSARILACRLLAVATGTSGSAQISNNPGHWNYTRVYIYMCVCVCVCACACACACACVCITKPMEQGPSKRVVQLVKKYSVIYAVEEESLSCSQEPTSVGSNPLSHLFF